MINQILILSQREAVERIPHLGDVSVISIVDDGDENPKWSENVKAHFDLRFDDTENSLNEDSAKVGDFKGLKNFIDTLPTSILIIHCFAGISRSAGVAAAISEYIGLRMKIWTNKRYEPNVLVYELVKSALQN